MATPVHTYTWTTPLRALLLLFAVVLFLLAFFGISFGSFQLIPLGLAFFAASFWVP